MCKYRERKKKYEKQWVRLRVTINQMESQSQQTQDRWGSNGGVSLSVQTHATHLGISARLTAVTLTQLSDVSTITKTLVETLNDVFQNLDATGSVDSSAVHAGRAQTLAKFFYDRNDHGRSSMFGCTWRSQIPCLHGKNRFHVRMDLTLLAHLWQVLVPLVDSGSKGGDLIGTTSTTTTTTSSSTARSACLLRTQSNQEDLMRRKLPGYTSRRLHRCCPCMLLYDSVQLCCPLHITSHRSIDRRGGTQRRLLASSSWLLWQVACLGKCCVQPHRFCIFVHDQQRWLPPQPLGRRKYSVHGFF